MVPMLLPFDVSSYVSTAITIAPLTAAVVPVLM